MKRAEAAKRLMRQRYGASGLHLLAHITAFAIAAYALAQIISGGRAINFLLWFAGAALLHDLVFLPFYSLLDTLAGLGVSGPRIHTKVPVINHIRAPALISGLLLLIYFPLIFAPGDSTYFGATGHHIEGYARNWLLITAALFSGSAVLYAARLGALARRERPPRASASREGDTGEALPGETGVSALPEDEGAERLPEDEGAERLPEDEEAERLPEDEEAERLPENAETDPFTEPDGPGLPSGPAR